MSDWTTSTNPLLVRIAMTTASTPDMAAFERCYRETLGYRTVDKGTIGEELARSWGAPATAESRYCVMSPEGEENVYVRAVEAPEVAGYRPLTTFGWNAFEIVVENVHALAERIASSPFEILDGPHPLKFMPSIVAMQVVGPGGECLYFTMETGDRDASILPRPSGFVGRTFIVVASGPDFHAMLRWYVDKFQLRERPIRQSKVGVIQRAQGLDSEHTIFLSAIGLRNHGNLLELDGYPTGSGLVAGPRPRPLGHLPPGNAVVSFEVADLAPYEELAIAPPQVRPEAGYEGHRACVIVGPAGELIELIDAL